VEEPALDAQLRVQPPGARDRLRHRGRLDVLRPQGRSWPSAPSPNGATPSGSWSSCLRHRRGYTLLPGPQIARQDLRSDLPNADLLKTFPIEGWRLALGELLAPTAILTSILWVTILVAATIARRPRQEIEWLTPSVRATAALCLALAAPFLCLIQLIVPNTVMVLMPAGTSRRAPAGPASRCSASA
jgi:hypothetical protein